MAEPITIRMIVGSHLPHGGDNPVTQLGMVAIADLPGNVEIMGSPVRGDISLFVKDPLVTGVGLGTEYDVTFTPVD